VAGTVDFPMAIAGLSTGAAAAWIGDNGTPTHGLRVALTDGGSGAIVPWQSGHVYGIGDDVSFAGGTFRVLQAHTAQTGLEPPNAYALFARRMPSWTWATQVLYEVGDEAVYAGRRYEALQAHQAAPGLEPVNAAADRQWEKRWQDSRGGRIDVAVLCRVFGGQNVRGLSDL